MSLIISLLLFGSLVYSSNLQQCYYTLEVKDLSLQKVSAKLRNSAKSATTCSKFKDTQEIKINKIVKGKSLLKRGKKLKGKKSIYNAMGPNGPVFDVSWELSPLK